MTRFDADSLAERLASNPDLKIDMRHSQQPVVEGLKVVEKYKQVSGNQIRREKESDFASWFEDFLHRFGYKFMHVRPARVKRDDKEIYESPFSGDGKGWEDYFIWHEDKHIYFLVELKSEKGELSGNQKEIIESHRKAGLSVFVYRPSDREAIGHYWA